MSADTLFAAVQEACLPGVWSKGVALSRGDCFLPGSVKPDEIHVRVLAKDRPVHPNVTLWPQDEEEDWFCDCGDRNDPCHHIAAAVIALKAGTLNRASPSEIGAESAAGNETPARQSTITQVVYRFRRLADQSLGIDRHILRPLPPGPVPAGAFSVASLLRESLVAHVGGIRSGRISGLPVAATQEDFAADLALGSMSRGQLERSGVSGLLKALESSFQVFIEDQPVRVSAKPVPIRARLTQEGTGFRIARVKDPAHHEGFTNGLTLHRDAQNELVLRPLQEAQFSPEEREMLSAAGDGRFFPARMVETLVTDVIPALERKIDFEINARLPTLETVPARMLIRMEKSPVQDGDGGLVLVPFLVYGNPPLARLEGDKMELTFPDRIPKRDFAEERRLTRKLQDELHLQPGQLTRFRGLEAVEIARKLQNWETTGGADQAFRITGVLNPQLNTANGKFEISFGAEGNGHADPRRVFEAWNRKQDFVPLLEGGWARVPKEWLAQFGDEALALLQARRQDGTLPSYRLPELAQLCTNTGHGLPEGLRKLRAGLEDFAGIPAAPLPRDLRAELRHYQTTGVNWLCFLREAEMGALLADDMGLGKTLQALCAIQGRTLIVCPTSVLSSWTSQLSQFRPGLTVAMHHGSSRFLNLKADVVLTSYGILRQDRELLSAQTWDTVILDEAQIIKNPESQVAQAAYQLQGRFRIALTGTPIENRLEDLWSQFQFLNPGLLGERADFGENAADRDSLRGRIRPFILRRLKRDVAPELPARTETVLHSELNEEEQRLYRSILAATQREVVEKLEKGGNIMAALEALLRLRQTCCHAALVPGNNLGSGLPGQNFQSSKFKLLLETLETSLSLGHRALIFSQWTSLLDLLEPELARQGTRFSRLDGSSRDRGALVEEFQAPDGPPVMLISLKAGGVGLTLTAADHIFILDPWWNPAVEDQAADRAHRIGQKNPVLIHRLVAKDTVEDRILELQKRKKELAASLLEGAEAATQLTRDDLLALLA